MSDGDFKRGADPRRGPHRFQKGQSGNPNGRPKIAAAIEKATGKSMREVSAEMFELLYQAAHKLDPGDKDESASWRYSVGTILGYIHGKPKEQVEVTNGDGVKIDVSDLTDEQLAALAAVKIPDGADESPTEH